MNKKFLLYLKDSKELVKLNYRVEFDYEKQVIRYHTSPYSGVKSVKFKDSLLFSSLFEDSEKNTVFEFSIIKVITIDGKTLEGVVFYSTQRRNVVFYALDLLLTFDDISVDKIFLISHLFEKRNENLLQRIIQKIGVIDNERIT